MERLPTVVVTSVIRSSHQGESHGGAYLVDLEAGTAEQVIDWNDARIDWEGRGGDRGLRGLAFHGDRVLLAASDEVFVYDRDFRPQGSYRNRYLKHCHEIFVQGDVLYLTSTMYDSVLALDLARETFTDGWLIRNNRAGVYLNKLRQRPLPRLRRFDPLGDDGPHPEDTLHLNSVHVEGGAIFTSGRNAGTLYRIRGDELDSFSAIPYGTHNARPYRDGVMFNETSSDALTYQRCDGSVAETWRVRHYDPADLEMAGLPNDHARQGFGRGLCLHGDLIIGGSSPATVSVYRHGEAEPVRSVNLTMDVRNAVHGLEVWPF